MIEMAQRRYVVKRIEEEKEKKARELSAEFESRVKSIQSNMRSGYERGFIGTLHTLEDLGEMGKALNRNYADAKKQLEQRAQYLKDNAMLEEHLILGALLSNFIYEDFLCLLDEKKEQPCPMPSEKETK